MLLLFINPVVPFQEIRGSYMPKCNLTTKDCLAIKIFVKII